MNNFLERVNLRLCFNLKTAAVLGIGLPLLAIGTARAADPTPVASLKLLAEGFAAPIALCSLPDGSGRLLVADQAGLIYLLAKDGRKESKPFIDLRSKVVSFNQGMDERGITGMAPHPQFKTNHKFYVAYNVPLRPGGPKDWNNTMRVSEFQTSERDVATLNLETERVVLEIDKPDWNHNSGQLAFGPDGYLYISVGDGGAPNDVGRLGHAPEGNGQHLDTLLGKMLRIDVDNKKPYGIPTDNPYADGRKARPEIYAYGLRNPWGMSFDRGGSRELIVADVGQERWEEVNIIVNGGNYGWRLREGFDGFDLKNTRTAPAEVPKVGADGKPLIDPVTVYKTFRGNREDPESFGSCINGGYVYRGKAIPQLAGKYVFGDWSRNLSFPDGMLLVATRPEKSATNQRWTVARLPVKEYPDGRIKAFVWGFGEDDQGELYVLTTGANLVSGTRGKVFKITPL